MSSREANQKGAPETVAPFFLPMTFFLSQNNLRPGQRARDVTCPASISRLDPR